MHTIGEDKKVDPVPIYTSVFSEVHKSLEREVYTDLIDNPSADIIGGKVVRPYLTNEFYLLKNSFTLIPDVNL